ncbi:hypothetical protein [Microbacterium album]|uniref:Uncharacterized protein n=1 Tax=Microbacterium album TaxID=2053191 RepID=A0A917IB91_9MICO|nr:hypothetical protein [Microbacterium album]GGH34197.1 hypothetical protein GCM10010921_01720 [Microbacterium album]
MAAAQTAEQKATAQKAAADSQASAAAEQDVAAKKAAEDKAAAEQAAADAERARLEAAKKAASQLQVIGPVAVLPLKSGGERYVYRGAPVGDEFTEEGVKHAQSVGLVGKPKK